MPKQLRLRSQSGQLPEFRNDRAAAEVWIGVKEFNCIGVSPPHDHPHVYLTMGNDDTILCPYCSTAYRYDQRVGPSEAEPSDSVYMAPGVDARSSFEREPRETAREHEAGGFGGIGGGGSAAALPSPSIDRAPAGERRWKTMKDEKLRLRLSDLGDRLVKLRERTRENGVGAPVLGISSNAAMGFALRAGVGMMTTLVCGAGLGWLIDHWLGTMPLFLILFFFLGAGAGLFNIFSSAKALER
jgi:uncharacterized Zn-finger protein/F0F1-type ATP synthase assembly protein I